MTPETYTLCPSVVADKARKLADVGLHQQALEMLERNCIEARVYPTYVEMSIPRQPKRTYAFKKGHKISSSRSMGSK